MSSPVMRTVFWLAEIRAASAIAPKMTKVDKEHRENSGRYLSRFWDERIIELIFVTIAWPLRQTLLSNIRPEAFSQRVEPDALLLQGFHQI